MKKKLALFVGAAIAFSTQASADDQATEVCNGVAFIAKGIAQNARKGTPMETIIAKIHANPKMPLVLQTQFVTMTRVVYAAEGTFDPDEFSHATFTGCLKGVAQQQAQVRQALKDLR